MSRYLSFDLLFLLTLLILTETCELLLGNHNQRIGCREIVPTAIVP